MNIKAKTKKSVTEKDHHDLMIGKLAIHYKFLDNKLFNRAQSLQKKEIGSGLQTTLKEIFIKHEILSTEQMEMMYLAKDLITKRREEKRFGAIAVEKGLLTAENLENALIVQEQSGENYREIGQILVEEEILTNEQRNETLEIQKKIIVALPALNEIKEHLENIKKTVVKKDRQKDEKKVTHKEMFINISDNKMLAVLDLSNTYEEICVDDVCQLLNLYDIKFGVIEDKEINEFLTYKDIGVKTFIVAKGKKEIDAEPSETTYHFQTRDLTAGELQDDGKMDFKKRGGIPHVEEGHLLAERTEARIGKPGVDIFGENIEIGTVEENFFQCGTGTFMDEKNLKIFAQLSGEPRLSFNGTVSVYKEYLVDNDVGYETGHIDFDGNVVVAGKVNTDFEVKGINISAQEVLGAKIEAEGDVHVEGGIIGGDIKAQGKVTAKYVKDSRILSIGDIIIEKEIIDSNIETSGVCITQNGNILFSEIVASKGVSAINIGSATSKPSRIEVGTKKNSENLISEINGREKKHHDLIKKLHLEQENMVDMQRIMLNVVQEIEEDRNKNITEKGSVETMMVRMKKKSKRELPRGGELMKYFDSKIVAAEETISTLLNDGEMHNEKIEGIGKNIKDEWNEVAKLEREIEEIRNWIEENNPVPVVRVFGTIFDKTSIFGPNAKTILNNDFKNVRVKEVKTSFRERGNAVKKIVHKFQIVQM